MYELQQLNHDLNIKHTSWKFKIFHELQKIFIAFIFSWF